MNELSELLVKLVNAYRPSWYHQMGKVGYECGYCRCVIRIDFWEPENHQSDCALIQAHKAAMTDRANNDAVIDALTANAGAIT